LQLSDIYITFISSRKTNQKNQTIKTMKIKKEVFAKIIEALQEGSAYNIFNKEIGMPEEHTEDEAVALMWDLDSEKLILIKYANPSNSWAKTAEGQNPWIHLGYVSGYDCIDGDPFGYIEGEITRIQEEEYN
jgi:hypothetical protein